MSFISGLFSSPQQAAAPPPPSAAPLAPPPLAEAPRISDASNAAIDRETQSRLAGRYGFEDTILGLGDIGKRRRRVANSLGTAAPSAAPGGAATPATTLG